MELVDQVGEVVEAVLVSTGLGESHVGVLGEGPVVQGVERVDWPSAPKTVPPRRCQAHLRMPLRLPAAIVSVLSGALDEGRLAIEVVGAQGDGRGVGLGSEDCAAPRAG